MTISALNNQTTQGRQSRRTIDQLWIELNQVLDTLEDCDQLAIGLGRLRRLHRMSAEDWSTAAQRLEEIRLLVAAGRTDETRGEAA